MFYDRKIRYLDYCRSGERVKSGGFAKTEVQDDSFKMEITLKGIPGADRESVDVLLCGDGKEAVFGRLTVKGGFGEFRHSCSVKNGIDGSGIEYSELSGIKIPLSETEEISCKWDADKSSTERKKKDIAAAEGVAGEQRAEGFFEGRRKKGKASETTQATKEPEKTVSRKEEKSEPVEEPEKVFDIMEKRRDAVEKIPEHRQELMVRTSGSGPEPVRVLDEREPESMDETEYQKEFVGNAAEQQSIGNSQRRQPEAVTLLEDKWLQLAAIYPHIKPFRDEREYLSVGPADFVLFSEESYRAANNSFLLHGYYNYRHLILTRVERRGEILYYVGVPGNYYDREKQVAVMFGFESFECAEEPAQNGDFGYYMMKVQI